MNRGDRIATDDGEATAGLVFGDRVRADFGNGIPVKRKREERIVVRELPMPGLSRRMACITEKPCADQLREPKPGTHLVS